MRHLQGLFVLLVDRFTRHIQLQRLDISQQLILITSGTYTNHNHILHLAEITL